VTDCEPCRTADRTGWFGSNDAHCRTCHRTWRGTAQVHCVTCHQHFTSVSTCEAHQPRGGSCLDPHTARDKKGEGERIFVQVDRYGGPTWARNAADFDWGTLR
jgi:hypothetical protein